MGREVTDREVKLQNGSSKLSYGWSRSDREMRLRLCAEERPSSSIPWCFDFPWCFLTMEIPWCFEYFQLLFSAFPGFSLWSRGVKTLGVLDGFPWCLPKHQGMEDQGSD